MKLPLIIASFVLALPTSLYAQDKVYSPLVDLSNAGQGNDVQSFENYINFLYGMSIAVAALLAVIKIIIAGTKYMLDDVISGKEDAKKDIQGAVLGLLLIISAVIILELINPELINKEIKFDKLEGRVELAPPSLTTTAGGQTNQEFASGLAQNLDSCVLVGAPKTSADGASTRVTADFNQCSEDNEAQQRETFQNNCNQSGGSVTYGGRGSGVVICSTFNQNGILAAQLTAAQNELKYIQNTFGFNADPDGDGTRTTYKLPDEYIRLDGTTITVESKRFCDTTFSVANTPKLNVEQRRGLLDGCASHNWGSSRCGNINNGYNRDATVTDGGFTCPMPKQIVSGNSLKIGDPTAGGTRPVNSWAEALGACGKNNDLLKTGGIVYGWQDAWLGGLDLSDYECFRY